MWMQPSYGSQCYCPKCDWKADHIDTTDCLACDYSHCPKCGAETSRRLVKVPPPKYNFTGRQYCSECGWKAKGVENSFDYNICPKCRGYTSRQLDKTNPFNIPHIIFNIISKLIK